MLDLLSSICETALKSVSTKKFESVGNRTPTLAIDGYHPRDSPPAPPIVSKI